MCKFTLNYNYLRYEPTFIGKLDFDEFIGNKPETVSVGGSRHIPSFMGCIGKFTLYRNRLINIDEVIFRFSYFHLSNQIYFKTKNGTMYIQTMLDWVDALMIVILILFSNIWHLKKCFSFPKLTKTTPCLKLTFSDRTSSAHITLTKSSTSYYASTC